MNVTYHNISCDNLQATNIINHDLQSKVNSVSAGTGITITGTPTNPIINSTGVSGVASVAGGTGISISGTPSDPIVDVSLVPVANGGTNSTTALTNDKVMISGAGSIVESSTTSTELSYLNNVTSDIQQQLDSKNVGNTLIYSPNYGGTSATYFANWGNLMTALTALRASMRTIYVELDFKDGQTTITIPPGAYDLGNVILTTGSLDLFLNGSAPGFSPELILTDVTFDELAGFDGIFTATVNNTLVGSLLSSTALNKMRYLTIKFTAVVCNTGSQPIWTVNLPGGTARLQMLESSFITGTNAINNQAGVVRIFMRSGGSVNNNTLSGVGSYDIVRLPGTVFATPRVQPGTGAFSYNNSQGWIGQSHYISTVDPTSAENVSVGFANGDRWYNNVNQRFFIMINAGVGTWMQLANLISTVLPIVNGGTASSTALVNNRVMVSNAGAIREAAVITANRALISDVNGLPTHSVTSSTEVGFLSGTTSNIQTQLSTKSLTGLIQTIAAKIILYTLRLTV
jgi:hypothetical protein